MAAKKKRYGDLAETKVERAMHEMKRGTLRSGRGGRKVTNPKQAIAIGLSEARRAGGKVPAEPKRKAPATRTRKTTTKRTPATTRKRKPATTRKRKPATSRKRKTARKR